MMNLTDLNEPYAYEDSFGSRVTLTLSGLRDPVHAIQLSPDGKYLALGNDGGNLEVYLFTHDQVCHYINYALDSRYGAWLGEKINLQSEGKDSDGWS